MKYFEKMQERLGLWLYTGFLAVTAIFLALHLVLPDQSFSNSENRSLSGFPAITSISADGIDDWFNDQFPFRGLLRNVDFCAKWMSGIRQFEDVYVGRGRLFLKDPDLKSEEVQASTSEKVTAIQNFALNNLLDTTVQIVPTAQTVYEGRLPMGTPAQNEQAYIKTVLDPLSHTTYTDDWGEVQTLIKTVDCTQMLTDQKDAYLYYKTDHHWTSRGAYFAAKAWAESKGIDLPDLSAYTEYTVSTSFRGTLASTSGDPFLCDDVDLYIDKNMPDYLMTKDGEKRATMYVSDAVNDKDVYQVFTGSNAGIVRFEMDNDSEVRLLLIKDSYANSMVQFLLPYCRTITMVDPRYFTGSLSRVVGSDLINEVLFLYNVNSFAGDESLVQVLSS